MIEVAAGEPWDPVVEPVVADGWSGLASLSGIPGSSGATPIQNVGAYGAEVGDVLLDVTVLDRRTGTTRLLPAADLRLGYRTSVLRGSADAVVLRVRFRLNRRPTPVRYGELATTLGLPAGGAAAPGDIARAAVLTLRRGKGMVIDPADPDTRSVGSFFTNPLLGRRRPRRRGRPDPGSPGRRDPLPPVSRRCADQAVCRLADRAVRLRQGVRPAARRRRDLVQAHPGADQPRRQHRRPAGARPARPGRRRGRLGVRLEPEPILVGVTL